MGGSGKAIGFQRGESVRNVGGRFPQEKGWPYVRPAQQITAFCAVGDGRSSLHCYTCGGGHFTRECPQRFRENVTNVGKLVTWKRIASRSMN